MFHNNQQQRIHHNHFVPLLHSQTPTTFHKLNSSFRCKLFISELFLLLVILNHVTFHLVNAFSSSSYNSIIDIKELNNKNIYADGTVDCGEWDYYSFDIPADVRVQRFYLSFRFTKLNDPSTNDVQAISIFFKLNAIPNITYHDAVTTSPTVPISLDYLQPNSTGYIAVLGRGMCQEGQETTNYYLFQGYLDREGPLPSWAIVIIIVGSGLLFSVVAISLSVAYRHFKHRKRREYERL